MAGEELTINDNAFDDPMVSIQWEDAEANLEKEATELMACNSSCVYIWDIADSGRLKYRIDCQSLSKDTKYINECKAVKRDPHN